MLKAYKYRLYPTEAQKVLINKHIGACRFVYNLALETKQMAYLGSKVNLSLFDLQKQLPDLKKECEWLKEINAQSLQQSITDLDKAFTGFFKGNNYPNFKNKKQKQSFRVPQKTYINSNKLFIPKFLEGIDIIIDRYFIGQVKSSTISKTYTNKYFVSILVETNESIPQKPDIKPETTIGIDFGIKTFIVTSENDQIKNPKYLKQSLDRLKVLQRRSSKKKLSSNNRKKANLKTALLHEKIANQRKDFLHKLSTKLIRENQSIAIENLNIEGMQQNHNLAQAISDVSWGEFIRQLTYKSEWCGVNLLTIGRFDPSSKLCNNCGYHNKDLTLIQRTWKCPVCKTDHSRDHNAAKNIKAFALRNSGQGMPGEPVELPTLVGAMKQEVN